MNSLPYAVDGLFVQSDLSVIFKYSMEDKKWVVARIDDEDGESVWLDGYTLKMLTLQARVRINAALDYISWVIVYLELLPSAVVSVGNWAGGQAGGEAVGKAYLETRGGTSVCSFPMGLFYLIALKIKISHGTSNYGSRAT